MINKLAIKTFLALSNFRKNESGAALAEYGILVALIAVVSIGIITLLGGQITDAFTQVTNDLGSIKGIRKK